MGQPWPVHSHDAEHVDRILPAEAMSLDRWLLIEWCSFWAARSEGTALHALNADMYMALPASQMLC